MAGKPIVVISREEGSGTRDAFETMAMNGAHVTRTALVMPSEAAVVDYVARNPTAIGYTSMGALTQDVRALTIDDVPLSRETVESQKYPFIRTLSFVVPQSSNARDARFHRVRAERGGAEDYRAEVRKSTVTLCHCERSEAIPK